jgi:hypothetical protein
MGGIRLVGQGKRPQLIPILGYSVAQGLVPARNASQREVGGLLSRRRSRWVGFASGEAGGNQAGARDAGPGLGNILIGHKRSNKLFQSLILTLFQIVRESTKKKSTNPRP